MISVNDMELALLWLSLITFLLSSYFSFGGICLAGCCYFGMFKYIFPSLSIYLIALLLTGTTTCTYYKPGFCATFCWRIFCWGGACILWIRLVSWRSTGIINWGFCCSDVLDWVVLDRAIGDGLFLFYCYFYCTSCDHIEFMASTFCLNGDMYIGFFGSCYMLIYAPCSTFGVVSVGGSCLKWLLSISANMLLLELYF